mgnify:CR=1 FL=1
MDQVNSILEQEKFNDTWGRYVSFLCDNIIEFWTYIIKYPNYQISTMGRVKVVKSNRIGTKHMNLIMSPEIKGGYCHNTIKNDKDRKSLKIHGLVAKHFIPNSRPYDRLFVDHIDGDKMNNKINNLRWVTHQENMNYYKETIEYKGKKIYQYDLDDNLIKEWNNVRDILDANKDYKYDSMLKCLSGQLDKLYNYKWKYDDKEEIKLKNDEMFKKIGMYGGMDLNNFEISNYGNTKNTSRDNILNGKINADGYREVCFYDNITKKSKYIKIHNLVATYFIGEKPNEKDMVNHKDKNRLNNHFTNLEWLSNQQNIEHACGRKIQQIDMNTGNVIKDFKSIKEACDLYKFGKNSHVAISACCRNKQKTAYGYCWKYI